MRNKTEGGEGASRNDRLGIRNPMYGKKHSAERNKKQSQLMKGIKRSVKTIQKRLDSVKGMYAGINNPMYGKTHSSETKQKLTDAAKARIKLQCAHCNKIVDASNYRRWHDNNCKMK